MQTQPYVVQTAGFHKVDVTISPIDYAGINPENLALAEQLVRETVIDAGVKYKIHSKDHGRPIGKTDCILVQPSDDVVYAQLKGRNVYGKFVRGRKTELCSHLTIVLKFVRDRWRLIRVFIGEHAPAFPGDPNVASASRDFWSRHALLLDAIPIQEPRVFLTRCPW